MVLTVKICPGKLLEMQSSLTFAAATTGKSSRADFWPSEVQKQKSHLSFSLMLYHPGVTEQFTAAQSYPCLAVWEKSAASFKNIII